MEVAVMGSSSLTIPIDSLCGRKSTLNLNGAQSELRGAMKVKVAILGSPSLVVLMIRGRKVTVNFNFVLVSEPRRCVKVEVAVLGSPSLTIPIDSLCGRKAALNSDAQHGHRAQEVCESGGGRP